MTDDASEAGGIPLNIAGHDEEKQRRQAEDEAEADDDSVLSEFDVAETSDDEVEPVELLVQLAKDGEIEPWDIDIVVVTDKFLDRLDEADLRAGGRALFYASVLLRMKSDAMLADDEPEEEPWDAAPMDEPFDDHDPFVALEKEIDRRLDRKHARGTPQTLDELVHELRDRERETMWKESRTYDTSGSPHGYARGTQTLDYHSGDDFRMDDEPREADALGTAHDEHMEDIINDVYLALQQQYDKGRDEVLYEEISAAGGGRVDTFLGLLFLAHRGQVRLQQDELFGDLWIQDPAAVSESAEALADGGEIDADVDE
ncbi:segregation and condensation protein A [Halorarius litoreus]|uniref:segregation and condensation protein A n=1 Tax=Halorarius litoreus TaxID=2962676 RepID=UPI0020CFD0CA|nr:ScpA family protein [Halorarius litoreus]